MKKLLTVFAAFLFLSPHAHSVAFEDPNKTKITITVTTSDIYRIVKEIGGDKVDVQMIIQPVICPSNYDIIPRVVERTENSNLVLSHKWETWIEKLKVRAKQREILYKQLQTKGNWMIPYIHVHAAGEIKEMLSYMDADNAGVNQDRKSVV